MGRGRRTRWPCWVLPIDGRDGKDPAQERVSMATRSRQPTKLLTVLIARLVGSMQAEPDCRRSRFFVIVGQIERALRTLEHHSATRTCGRAQPLQRELSMSSTLE